MNRASENPNRARVAIRLASESDAIMLAQLRYAFRSSFGEVSEHDESFAERCTLWMQQRLRDPSSWRCWIAECGDEPVGNLWAELIEKIPNPTSEHEHHAYLTNLYVREDYRGNGIGSMLLSAALVWIQTRDVHAVILWPTEQSRSFYLRHGFSVGGDLMEMLIATGKDDSLVASPKPNQPD